jgi:branched-chain amino acid transport system ATP-binding protein
VRSCFLHSRGGSIRASLAVISGSGSILDQRSHGGSLFSVLFFLPRMQFPKKLPKGRVDLIMSNALSDKTDILHSPLLQVKNLTMDFGGLRALSGVSFEILPGEIAGVIGPNGAGKTTLFALLSGFLSPSQGEILFMESQIAGKRPDRLCHLGIARTFQVVRPFLEMTVFENIKAAAVFGKPERRSAVETNREVGEIMESTGLSALSDHESHSLSLPERKRLEVARALATGPKLLLLDEVLAGLNPREVEEAIPFVQSLNTKRSISIIMVEHNLRAIMGICRRILVLNFGQLIFDGSPGAAVENRDVINAYLGEREDAQS